MALKKFIDSYNGSSILQKNITMHSGSPLSLPVVAIFIVCILFLILICFGFYYCISCRERKKKHQKNEDAIKVPLLDDKRDSNSDVDMKSHPIPNNYPADVVINVEPSPESPKPVEYYPSAKCLSNATNRPNAVTSQGSKRLGETEYPVPYGINVITKEKSIISLKSWLHEHKLDSLSVTDADTSQGSTRRSETEYPVSFDINIITKENSNISLKSWLHKHKLDSVSLSDADTSHRPAPIIKAKNLVPASITDADASQRPETLKQANNPVPPNQNIDVRQASSSLESWGLQQQNHVSSTITDSDASQRPDTPIPNQISPSSLELWWLFHRKPDSSSITDFDAIQRPVKQIQTPYPVLCNKNFGVGQFSTS